MSSKILATVACEVALHVRVSYHFVRKIDVDKFLAGIKNIDSMSLELTFCVGFSPHPLQVDFPRACKE